MKLSVIIPALNEGAMVRDAVASAEAGAMGAAEVIVVDGGSSDETKERAAAAGALVISSTAGRGAQMDRGARESSGDVLLFLHADTRLPAGWARLVEDALSEEKVVGGAFTLSIASEGVRFRLVERLATLRSRLGLVYGDQAIFARREAFFSAGGFKKLPLMEDVDCVKRLNKIGRLALLSATVVASGRRWKERGVFFNTLKNWSILLFYSLGVSPRRLYEWYYGRGL